jgi:hypothetical protein
MVADPTAASKIVGGNQNYGTKRGLCCMEPTTTASFSGASTTKGAAVSGQSSCSCSCLCSYFVRALLHSPYPFIHIHTYRHMSIPNSHAQTYFLTHSVVTVVAVAVMLA